MRVLELEFWVGLSVSKALRLSFLIITRDREYTNSAEDGATNDASKHSSDEPAYQRLDILLA